MRERRAVQFVAMHPPGRHQGVHPLQEALVVVAFVQMHHLVDQDVFNTGHGFLDQLEIQPDPPGVGVAASPARLHPPDPHFGDRFAHAGLPLGNHPLLGLDLALTTLFIRLLLNLPAATSIRIYATDAPWHGFLTVRCRGTVFIKRPAGAGRVPTTRKRNGVRESQTSALSRISHSCGLVDKKILSTSKNLAASTRRLY